MNKSIISIIICITLIYFTLVSQKELFSCGPHTIVDIDGYMNPSSSSSNSSSSSSSNSSSNSLTDKGPSCLTQCLVENIPKVYWDIPEQERNNLIGGFNSDILQFNRENPDRAADYCYNHNSDNGNNTTDLNDPCDQNCKTTCQADSRCRPYTLNNNKEVCGEDKLNIMSSGANLNISNCKSCVQKYWNNISNIWNTYQDSIMPNICET